MEYKPLFKLNKYYDKDKGGVYGIAISPRYYYHMVAYYRPNAVGVSSNSNSYENYDIVEYMKELGYDVTLNTNNKCGFFCGFYGDIPQAMRKSDNGTYVPINTTRSFTKHTHTPSPIQGSFIYIDNHELYDFVEEHKEDIIITEHNSKYLLVTYNEEIVDKLSDLQIKYSIPMDYYFLNISIIENIKARYNGEVFLSRNNIKNVKINFLVKIKIASPNKDESIKHVKELKSNLYHIDKRISVKNYIDRVGLYGNDYCLKMTFNVGNKNALSINNIMRLLYPDCVTHTLTVPPALTEIPSYLEDFLSEQ